jgi:hypothetical protein
MSNVLKANMKAHCEDSALQVMLKMVEVNPSGLISLVLTELTEALAATNLYSSITDIILLRAVDDLYLLPIAENYAKIIPIAQSSGTGKSKTVDQVAKQQILFPLCLCEHIGSRYFSV